MKLNKQKTSFMSILMLNMVLMISLMIPQANASDCKRYYCKSEELNNVTINEVESFSGEIDIILPRKIIVAAINHIDQLEQQLKAKNEEIERLKKFIPLVDQLNPFNNI